MLPFGLLAATVDGKEMRVEELAENGIILRSSEQIKKIQELQLHFFSLKEQKYHTIQIQEPEKKKEKKEQFYYSTRIAIEDPRYEEERKRLLAEYSRYIRLKLEESDQRAAEELAGYPQNLDQIDSKDFEEQKRKWMEKVGQKISQGETDKIYPKAERAIVLQDPMQYQAYLRGEIQKIKDLFLNIEQNCHPLLQEGFERIYVGNQWCPNLFPSTEILAQILERAKQEQKEITVAFPYMMQQQLKVREEQIRFLADWCRQKKKRLEVIVNDWGMASLAAQQKELIVCMGILLNKQRKDPRYRYKLGYEENQEQLEANNLQVDGYQRFLQERFHIKRYEWEHLGRRISLPESGRHSLHLPFYQTNTSQLCPLYAAIVNQDRGRQEPKEECGRLCGKYAFLYPDDLKMVGRYNSLFAFEEQSLFLTGKEEFEKIDRIVVNWL